jgi:hypothetical protein
MRRSSSEHAPLNHGWGARAASATTGHLTSVIRGHLKSVFYGQRRSALTTLGWIAKQCAVGMPGGARRACRG